MPSSKLSSHPYLKSGATVRSRRAVDEPVRIVSFPADAATAASDLGRSGRWPRGRPAWRLVGDGDASALAAIDARRGTGWRRLLDSLGRHAKNSRDALLRRRRRVRAGAGEP